MATYTLKVKKRELEGEKVSKLREQGLIPAVLYGHDIKNQNLSIAKNDFLKVYEQAGSSSLIDLQIDEAKPVKTLIQDFQINPLTDEIIHIDFYQIKEGEKITTTVELEFTGEAPAVKELGGVLVKNYYEIGIECLPKDLELIEKISVDLSVLKTFNDAIYIKDLQMPAEIKILEYPDQVVALVAPPREEEKEEEKPAEEMPEEVGAKEGEETKEGEKEPEAKEAESAEAKETEK